MGGDTTILTRPTVADVIRYLQQFDPAVPFRIEDPDTSWTIEIIKARIDDEAVWFTGDYHDMVTTRG